MFAGKIAGCVEEDDGRKGYATTTTMQECTDNYTCFSKRPTKKNSIGSGTFLLRCPNKTFGVILFSFVCRSQGHQRSKLRKHNTTVFHPTRENLIFPCPLDFESLKKATTIFSIGSGTERLFTVSKKNIWGDHFSSFAAANVTSRRI